MKLSDHACIADALGLMKRLATWPTEQFIPQLMNEEFSSTQIDNFPSELLVMLIKFTSDSFYLHENILSINILEDQFSCKMGT